MIITDEIFKIVTEECNTGCPNTSCRTSIVTMRDQLLDALRSDEVIDFKLSGVTYSLNRTYSRPIYSIENTNGKKMFIAFTGLSNIMVFSKRNRHTHCRATEFSKRIIRFLNSDIPFVHRPY